MIAERTMRHVVRLKRLSARAPLYAALPECNADTRAFLDAVALDATSERLAIVRAYLRSRRWRVQGDHWRRIVVETRPGSAARQYRLMRLSRTMHRAP